MFEKDLAERLTRIFDLPKVEYGLMSDVSKEQGILFVEIENAKNTVKQGVVKSKVTGVLKVNADNTKLPFGFFSKRIHDADSEDTQHFFFYDFEENALAFRGIVQRSVGFVYFFSGQYDPEAGSITSINLQTEVTE